MKIPNEQPQERRGRGGRMNVPGAGESKVFGRLTQDRRATCLFSYGYNLKGHK